MAKKSPSVTRAARECAEKWRSHWQFNINQYHQYLMFVLGQQWTEEESDILKSYRKIPIQVNKLATMISGLLAELQAHTPQIQVVPMQNCDEQTAEIRELVVKDLIFNSSSKRVYEECAKQAAIGGFSGFAVYTDYADKHSFDQNIYYMSFKDPTVCYWDISAEEPTKTDGMYCGWLSRVTRDRFRDIHGRKIEEKILPDNNEIAATQEEVAAVTSPGVAGNQFRWADDDSVTIQHHFKRKTYTEQQYRLSNGRIVNQDELDEIIQKSEEIATEQRLEQLLQQEQEQAQMQAKMQQQAQAMQDPNMPAGQYDPLVSQGQAQQPMQGPAPDPQPMQQDVQNNQEPDTSTLYDDQKPDTLTLYDDQEPVRIETSKEVKRYEIKYYQIVGEYILDETIFPGETLPLVFVDQNSFYDKSGKQVCRPFIIDAKDSQKYLNYLATQSAYVLKVSRFDQWLGSKKNVAAQDTQQIWRDPVAIQGMLTFDESPAGVVPQRIAPPELSQSLLTQYERAIQDLYTCTGLYPSRLGQDSDEVSGKAINARARQGSYVVQTAFAGLSRAITKGGEIVNEMIPYVYDAERVISLMTPDKGMQNITINKQADEYGELIENDIRKGTYQVRLIAGPSFEGQKQEALDSLNMILQANPQIFPYIADLYVENLPLANTIELKNRLRTLVPPNILEAGKTGESVQQDPQQDPQQMLAMQQQQMQQQQAQQQAAELQLKMRELQLKEQELQLKAQSQQASVSKDMQEIENERAQIAAQLQEQEFRYIAETHKTQTDAQIAHADNLAKILTHKL